MLVRSAQLLDLAGLDLAALSATLGCCLADRRPLLFFDGDTGVPPVDPASVFAAEAVGRLRAGLHLSTDLALVAAMPATTLRGSVGHSAVDF